MCGATNWCALPDPQPARSMTTAGRLIEQPLGKSQCKKCGSAQRIRAPMLAFTDYYENDYATYYERPGTGQFHAARYKAIWDWIISVLPPATPRRVLDIGCGQGMLMEHIKRSFPNAEVMGVEPSHFNTEIARSKGFEVFEGRLEAFAQESNDPWDLIVSTNVIQHVADPAEFLSAVDSLSGKTSQLAITAPDGGRPNIELLWADQNLSITPSALEFLAKLHWKRAKKSLRVVLSDSKASLPPAMLLCSEVTDNNGFTNNGIEPQMLMQLRRDYLNSFATIEEMLLEAIAPFDTVINLGTSYWASVLAVYCPRYWARVSICCVDSPGAEDAAYLGKPVLATCAAPSSAVLVLALAPMTQKAVAEKYQGSFSRVVVWDKALTFPF